MSKATSPGSQPYSTADRAPDQESPIANAPANNPASRLKKTTGWARARYSPVAAARRHIEHPSSQSCWGAWRIVSGLKAVRQALHQYAEQRLAARLFQKRARQIGGSIARQNRLGGSLASHNSVNENDYPCAAATGSPGACS